MWMSLRWVYSPRGPLVPERAAYRRWGKCFCTGQTGCPWGHVSNCQISFWSASWSRPWPGVLTPKSEERRSKHQAAGPQVWINRRLESYHLDKDKAVQRLRRGQTERLNGSVNCIASGQMHCLALQMLEKISWGGDFNYTLNPQPKKT